MQRRFALLSMIALFGVAYVTLDRVPRSVLRVLQTQAELTIRSDQSGFASSSEA
jgi:hypothetical protein